jgi:uncharacterized protein (TIGR00255 family)
MTLSMTGFTALEHPLETATLALEIRAVNSRYLDLHFKLDDHLKNCEPMMRELISAHMSRGKVECKLSLIPQAQTGVSFNLDENLLKQLALVSHQVQQHFPESAPLRVADILRWPNVLSASAIDQETLLKEAKSLVEKGLQDLNASRLREGEKLKALILERVASVEALVQKVLPLMAGLAKEYQARLESKLLETIKSFDEERMRQELVLFAQRVDVDEELTRLTAHVSEVKRILNHSAPAGKRLDFLMQELNREANTLGSKSVSVQTTQVSMELKVLIEQMREQIQNIE